MKKLSSFFVVLVMVAYCTPAHAQEPSPVLISGTTPISHEIRVAIENWLAVSPPVNTPYYAVTYFQSGPLYDFVSLVALQLASPDEEWNLEDGNKAVWIGTVKVFPDGTIEPYSTNQQSHSGHLARPSTAAGGGSYVSFPWQAGKGVIFGPRGIHGEGDYGTSGMFAVDLVSGSDLGASAASDKVYASDAGTVDYVCDDGTSVTIRTHNDTTDDYFIYAHLVDNANLAIDHDFSRGGFIGSLVHGSFDDTCGWAEQQDNHWHLHWMFTPASGAFQAESCILLTFSDKKWHCGTQVVGTGQWIIGGGGTGSGHDDPVGGTGYEGTGTSTLEGSIWDYFIIGIAFIIDPFFKLVPEHQGLNFTYVIQNTVELFFRLLYVFTYGNVNLAPVIIVVGFIVVIRGVLFLVWIGAFVFKAWKSLVPIFGA